MDARINIFGHSNKLCFQHEFCYQRPIGNCNELAALEHTTSFWDGDDEFSGICPISEFKVKCLAVIMGHKTDVFPLVRVLFHLRNLATISTKSGRFCADQETLELAQLDNFPADVVLLWQHCINQDDSPVWFDCHKHVWMLFNAAIVVKWAMDFDQSMRCLLLSNLLWQGGT